MNGLINVGELKTQMTSLEIARLTGKEHRNILRDIDSMLDQGIDVLNFEQTVYSDSQNRKQRMYSLTKKGCLILASGYDAKLREQIINRWEELEMKEKSQIKVPSTFREALLLAAEQQLVIEEQHKQIEVMQPKEEFYDAVVDSKDAIDMGQVAKVLNMGVGRNTLFQILRDKKVLMPNNNPYQQYLDNGYFRCVESRYIKPNGDTCINIKTVAFQRGLEYIRKIVSNHLNNK